MRIIIRAEDLHITDHRLILGGRVVQPSAIVFTNVERRVSAELLGFGLAIAVALVLLLNSTSSSGALGLMTLIGLLGLGARREILRCWVVVVELYQKGIVEIRGFYEDDAFLVFETLEEMRGGTGDFVHGPGIRSTGFS
jgi:MYXO-CTERM domain-containing protein